MAFLIQRSIKKRPRILRNSASCTQVVFICTLIWFSAIPSTDAACTAKFQIIPGHSACLSTSPNVVTSGVSATEKTEIVDRHNSHRANVNPTATNMLKMSWDDEVAMVAQTYAENCVYTHDSNYNRIIPGRYNAGQNLAAAGGAAYSWAAIVDLWHNEVADFVYGTGSSNGNPVGHYTQVVWAASHKIGCGYAECSNLNGGNGGHFYVCNYSPAGNMLPNQNTPYLSGATCSQCPSSCSGNLCDCSAYHCYNFGTFNVDTCACSCRNSASYYVGASCALNCTSIGTPSCPFQSSDCSVYSNVPFDCPVTCGWCPAGDSTGLLPVDGNWGQWTSWTNVGSCSQTCDQGTQTRQRTRSCESPSPSNGGANCVGDSSQTETITCNDGACPPVDGNWGQWTSWTNVGSCSQTCDQGTQTRQRTRSCDSPSPSNGGANCVGDSSQTETISCNDGACPPVDGNWGQWTSWTDVGSCSQTCDQGTHTRQRTRSCDSPSPSNGGANCVGDSSQTETISCNDGACPPVDGNWGQWTSWANVGSCSQTCDQGTQTRQRTRSCDSPSPSNGGANCVGDSSQTETISCNDGACPPVDGNWGQWTSWTNVGSCSQTCDQGTQTRQRTRSCDSPIPSNGGANCVGDSSQTETISCNDGACQPVDGNWGQWTSWTNVGSCSQTCDQGTQTRQRTRSCDSPSPSNGGANCVGDSSQTETISCNDGACPPVDGNWGQWTSWANVGSCSQTCDQGTQTRQRTRSCDSPSPSNGGANCVGDSSQTETISCNDGACPPVDGNWGQWTSWTNVGSCSQTCDQGTQTRQRTRSCDSPIPSNGGANCVGDSSQTETISCNDGACQPVDGNWGQWTSWTNVGSCSQTCDQGTQTRQRTRSCDSPSPSNGGANCVGDSSQTETISCNDGACPPVDGNWGQWTSWTNVGSCSQTCDQGTQTRQRTRSCDSPSPSNGGANCVGDSSQTETISCNDGACPPVDGNWGQWTSWTNVGSCSQTCDQGTQTRQRTRSCESPSPSNGGANCVGDSSQTETISCNDGACPPVDGNWGQWASWTNVGSCSQTCDQGTQTRQRTRSCDSPFPSNGGANCVGDSSQTETITCNDGACPPVDGNWGQWTSWTKVGSCRQTFDKGTQSRERTWSCDSPSPSNGGANCAGGSSETETISCNTGACPPFNGNWGQWTSWTNVGSCSQTCGGGTQNRQRTRLCDSPLPSNGGATCLGPSSESENIDCNTQDCTAGPTIQEVICNTDSDQSITVVVTNAQGYFVYVVGCSSSQGEYGGSGVPSANEQVTISDCGIQWDVSYQVVLATQQGIYSGLDVTVEFSCVRNTDPITATVGITATAGTASVSVTDELSPAPVIMKFTDGSSDKTGTAVGSATMGDVLHLHIYLMDTFTDGANGFDIKVKTITVSSGGTSIILTGVDGPGTADGCKSKAYWGEATDIDQGYVRVEFNAFILGGEITFSQTYTAVVEVCAGSACVNYVCPSGGSPQAGRKRRALSNETVTDELQARSELRIVPFRNLTATDNGENQVEGPQAGQTEHCEVCLDKELTGGVMAFGVLTILLTNAASVFLHLRAKRLKKKETTETFRHGMQKNSAQ